MKNSTKKKKKKTVKPPPSSEILKIAATLKALRLAKGFTSYEAFANEYDLSRALYGRYEKGQDMRISSLIKIVKAMDMTLPEFFIKAFS